MDFRILSLKVGFSNEKTEIFLEIQAYPRKPGFTCPRAGFELFTLALYFN